MSRTAALSREVASALAERLAEVVPRGFSVTAEGAAVLVHRSGVLVGSSHAAGILDEVGEDDPPNRVGGIAAAVLGGIQDEISEALTEPWPACEGKMVNADARQTGNTVAMWFGDEEAPVLRLRPLILSRVER